MPTTTKGSDARLNFRLSRELKATIEEAAVHRGQTVSDFAASGLAQLAREVIRQHEVTCLSNRDRQVLISALDEADAEPNEALTAAAKKYKRRA